MEMKEFMRKVQGTIQKELGVSFTVELKTVRKNNNVMLNGLMITAEERNVAPTIYLEQFWNAYREGMSYGEVIRRILEVYGKDKSMQNVDMDFFKDFEKVRDRVCYRLVGTVDNKDMLADVPHVEFLDLAVCFFYAYKGDSLGEGSILIHNSHMEMWKTGVAELMKAARENTPKLFPWQCNTMEEVLKEVLETEQVEEMLAGELPMKVLSNNQRMQGAVCLIYQGVLEKMAAEYKTDIYILPSSIHEVILLADTGKEPAEKLKAMIVQVNRSQLAPEEVLSDSLYRYDRFKKQVEIIL